MRSKIYLFIYVVILITFFGCHQQAAHLPGDGLDLLALLKLIEEQPSPAALEQALNKDGSVNNIELNGTGKPVFIHITEFGFGATKGLSLSCKFPGENAKELANVKFQVLLNKVVVQIKGNKGFYGSDIYYIAEWEIDRHPIIKYFKSDHDLYNPPTGTMLALNRSVAPLSEYRAKISESARSTRAKKATGPVIKPDLRSPFEGNDLIIVETNVTEIPRMNPNKPVAGKSRRGKPGKIPSDEVPGYRQEIGPSAQTPGNL